MLSELTTRNDRSVYCVHRINLQNTPWKLHFFKTQKKKTEWESRENMFNSIVHHHSSHLGLHECFTLGDLFCPYNSSRFGTIGTLHKTENWELHRDRIMSPLLCSLFCTASLVKIVTNGWIVKVFPRHLYTL